MHRTETSKYRAELPLDGLWSFRIQSAEDDPCDWSGGFPCDRMVAVPGAFNEQFTDYETSNFMGIAWYSRQIVIPVWDDRAWLIHFAAVNYSARVYLDGRLIGEHVTGYTPFFCRIPEDYCPGEHLLVVRVDCGLSPETVPQGGFDRAAIPGVTSPFVPSVNFDFFPYSGILRPVRLCSLPSVHVEDVRIERAEQLDDGTAILCVRANASLSGLMIRYVVEPGGESVSAISGEPVTISIREPKIWDVGNPFLYRVRAELMHDGRTVDACSRSFGIRTIRVAGDRLLLNGRPVYLRGFGRHEDMPVAGRGFCEAFHVRDIELLKWCGGNSFRTAHYPHAEEFLDLADRTGVLVIGESPAVSMIPSAAGEDTLGLHIRAVREMIARDAHHPSIVAWCLANEPHSHQPESVPYFESVFAAARREDPTRPMMLVMCRFPNEKCHHLCDLIGLNAYPGWYGGGAPLHETTAYFNRLLDEVRAITGKPVFMTEFGADAMAGLHSLPASLWTEDYQANLLSALLEVLAGKDYVVGEHIWAFADFHTAQNHFRAHGNRKGIFTRDRQPKLAAHVLRQRWGDGIRKWKE